MLLRFDVEVEEEERGEGAEGEGEGEGESTGEGTKVGGERLVFEVARSMGKRVLGESWPAFEGLEGASTPLTTETDTGLEITI